MKVYQALNQARDDFHRIKLTKSGFNKFAGYSYFELGDFLIPALNCFKDNNLCAFISFGKDVATMQIKHVEDSSTIEITSPMAEANLKGCHPIQNLGAVETYTRRYLWVSALEIVEHDALDSSAPIKAKGPAPGTWIETRPEAPLIPASPRTDDLGLDAEQIQWLEEFAQVVRTAIATDGPRAALNMIQAAGLDNEQRIALNNLLDSKTRSALKKAREEV